MKYCSNCASEVTFRAIEGDHLPRFVCDNCGEIHYQNPRVIVGCLPVWKGEIMLCRRGIQPQYGFWNIPGGFMENNETVEEGALREAKEEAGISANIKSLLSVFTVPYINQVHIHFLVELTEPTWHLTTETTEIQFFNEANFPWAEIAFPSNIFTLKTFFANQKSGDWNVKIGSFTK